MPVKSSHSLDIKSAVILKIDFRFINFFRDDWAVRRKGQPCAWGLAQRATSCGTRRESGYSHIGITLGYNEEAYVEKSLTRAVRNFCGTGLSSVTYAHCAFLNISLKQPVSMENSSLVSGGLILIVFMELSIQSSHFSRTTQQKIRYRVKQPFPGNMASSLANAS